MVEENSRGEERFTQLEASHEVGGQLTLLQSGEARTI